MFNYPKQAWDAAIQASYALEGKKDNISINFMVAAKLLDDEQLFLSVRQDIEDRGVDVSELNRYHKLSLGDWDDSRSYYTMWCNSI